MKRTKIVVLIFIMMFLISVVVLFAGGQKEGAKSGPVTITLMRDAAEMPDEVIKAFENKNPNIKINVVENDFTKLMTMIAGGTRLMFSE